MYTSTWSAAAAYHSPDTRRQTHLLRIAHVSSATATARLPVHATHLSLYADRKRCATGTSLMFGRLRAFVQRRIRTEYTISVTDGAPCAHRFNCLFSAATWSYCLRSSLFACCKVGNWAASPCKVRIALFARSICTLKYGDGRGKRAPRSSFARTSSFSPAQAPSVASPGTVPPRTFASRVVWTDHADR